MGPTKCCFQLDMHLEAWLLTLMTKESESKTGCHRLIMLVLIVIFHVGLIQWVEMDVSLFIFDPGFVAIYPSDVISVETFSAGSIFLVGLAKGFQSFKKRC